MNADVGNILSTAQGARVLAMQKTSRELDVVSARLASGLKVGSALDNPESFFLSRALRNRAGDLTRLLDGIGQNIRVVEEAEHGIEAQLKILDLAENYLLEVEKDYLTGDIYNVRSPQENESYVTFASSADLVPYVSSQDFPLTGPITTETNQVTFSGNFFKRKSFLYTITPETVLVFDYLSTSIPEFSMIGFDNNTNFSDDNRRFWISGTQANAILTVPVAAPISTFEYNTPGLWQRIEIPVGQYFTGTFPRITFINDDDLAPYGNSSFRNITLREGEDLNLAAISVEYEKILKQLDQVAVDAQYRGINLLKNDDMTTFFNESRNSKLVTKGMNATFEGLGLETKDFGSIEAVREKINQVRAARKTLQSYASTISTDLSIIQIRRNFTEGQINVHKAGADDLTVTDLNEEGANFLALQTRQQIQTAVLAMGTPNILSVLA